MKQRIFIPCLILFSLFLSNCKDKTDETPEPPTPPTVTFPVTNAVDGVFAAIKTTTINNTVESSIGTCYAAFYKNQNPAMKLDGGKVTLNSKECYKTDNSIYFIVPTATEPSGITLANQILWQVAGNTSTGVPSVYNKDDSGLPATPSIPEFINMMSDFNYLLNWASSSQSDSVIIIVKGPSATFKKTLNNTYKSYTIPKEEIAKLGVGKGTVQIINYKVNYATTGAKNYAYIKQSIAFTDKVTIQ
ncbi:MAG: hypothetical protein HUU47_06705 [Bacteroidetes bacterium]|nr:hypothetical protein [Bacteroidota bacterium]